MFCPQCGSQQSNELNFCKLCGANLQGVIEAMTSRQTGEKFDWNKTWVTEMFLSAGELKKRHEELELRRGITPEIKRYKEIKAGVITASVGIAVTIVLYVLMQGIILGGQLKPGVAEILSALWAVGLIPLFIGLALIVNGALVSKRLVEISRQKTSGDSLSQGTDAHLLQSGESGEFIPPGFSVTEDETRRLKNTRSNN